MNIVSLPVRCRRTNSISSATGLPCYFPFSCNRPSHGNDGVLHRVTVPKVVKSVIVPRANHIVIEIDDETQGFYIMGRPTIIGSGITKRESLDDRGEAAHFSIDALIDRELIRICNHGQGLE